MRLNAFIRTFTMRTAVRSRTASDDQSEAQIIIVDGKNGRSAMERGGRNPFGTGQIPSVTVEYRYPP